MLRLEADKVIGECYVHRQRIGLAPCLSEFVKHALPIQAWADLN